MTRPIPALVLLSVPLTAQPPQDWPKTIDADMKAGYTLLEQGKANEAAERFQAAMKTDPISSWPYSGMAELYLMASQHTSPEHVEEYRAKSEQFAMDALEREELDFHAASVLTQLKGGTMESHHQPQAEAVKPFEEAEVHYNANRYREAAPLYQKALELDPAFTNAALYEGDAWFMQGAYDKAEPLFRKAVELEPSYARAWRFLGDCQARMGHLKDAEQSIYGALAADPGDYTAWGRLQQVREALRKPVLARIQLPRITASVIRKEADGKLQLIVPEGMTGTTAESKAGLAYSVSVSMIEISDQKPENKGKARSALEKVATAWKAAMEVYESILAEKKATPINVSWSNLQALHKAGQLEEALMLLRFREAYRPDLETWKKAHPGAIQAFIEKWQLRP